MTHARHAPADSNGLFPLLKVHDTITIMIGLFYLHKTGARACGASIIASLFTSLLSWATSI
jgi:hypothetical protein